MPQDPTFQTPPNREDVSVRETESFAGHAEPELQESGKLAAVQFCAAEGDRSNAASAEDVVQIDDFPLSPLAAALRGDRGAFIEILLRGLGDGVLPDAVRDLLQQGDDGFDEEEAFESLVATIIEDRTPVAVVFVSAALAARTVAQSLFSSAEDFGCAEGEALLSAWFGAARAVERLRGAEGLLRLMPAARNLARRAAGRGELAPEIADAMRRVATRIADAEHSPGRTPRRLPQRRERERMESGGCDLPRRFVIRGQLQLTFHAR
jgi:hypothetical protein